MCDNCPCRDLIGNIPGIIPPLVAIVSDYAASYTLASYYKYVMSGRYICADEIGCNVESIKEKNAWYKGTNIIFFELMIPYIDAPRMNIAHLDHDIRYSYTFNVPYDKFSNARWHTDLHEILCVSNREISWREFRPGVPIPPEFNYACDYLLRDVDEWLNLAPRKMVCDHVNSAYVQDVQDVQD